MNPFTRFRSAASISTVVFALAAGLVPGTAGAAGGIGDLFVTSDASNIVRAFGGVTGNYLGNFTASSLGSGQMAIHFGAAQGRVLVGHLGGGVDEFDSSTGAYIKTYNPGGGWQWAGIYAPNGNVFIGSMSTNDVRQYDATTGAFISVLCPIIGPADMQFGPNGHLYVCSYLNETVHEIDPGSGSQISFWNLPPGSRVNDVAFLPNGEILVTAMGPNVAFRYDAAHNMIGTFVGTGWQRPHGIVVSPHDGNIYVVDGVTTQVHVFDSSTFVELNPAFLVPNPGDKIVDLDFRPDQPVPTNPTSWGRIKGLYR